MEDRPFRSVSLSSDLIEAIEAIIEAKKCELSEALLPSEFKSVAAFVAESTRLRLKNLKKGA